MKLTSLALLASLAVAGYVEAQTTQAPTPPPATSATAPATSETTPAKKHHHPLSKACRQEVKKACGSTHGDEMKSCVKDGLGANKFSADCQNELQKMHPEKSAS